jgi:PleD family two-component response regulator
MEKKRGVARVYLAGLEGVLGAELKKVLKSVECELTDDPKQAEIVFCGWGSEACRGRASCDGDVPVVVVSRLPDVDLWLDALEAGAADYCASPFEEVQVRWLLETHLRKRPGMKKARRAVA